ncbi:MAG: YihY/virulence factor BrkB family protein [Actinomycetia bacterium]|nr:YihY/virulence factor BrkB family protein [Actinomycetes bacterium]
MTGPQSWRGLLERTRDRLVGLRDRSPVVDRLVRSIDRYVDAEGNLLAAGVTYYGFLALFPLVAVAYGLVSLLAALVPALRDDVDEAVADYLPESVDVDSLTTAGLTVGVVGLGLLLYAGIRWLGGLRRSLVLLRGGSPRATLWWRGLLVDAVALVLLGGVLLVSVLVTVLVSAATSVVDRLLGTDSVLSVGLITVGGAAVALLTSWAFYLALLGALSGTRVPRRRLLGGALLGALGFEVLKQVLTLVVAAASRNVVYGVFATTVGLLVWISYASRWTLLVAAWTATSPQGALPAGVEQHDEDTEAPEEQEHAHQTDVAEA